MGKKLIRLAAILALLFAFGQVSWAQAKVGSVITAETQLYLKRLEVKNQNANARRAKALLREASLFVVCKPEADVSAVKAQIKALGAHLKGTIARTIMVSAPLDVVENIAAIEGIHYITKGPRVKQKTHISREVTGVNQALEGVAPLPQAYTGKGVIVGILDKGFDYTHPAFKDKDGNLRIKAVYMASVPGEEPMATADGDDLDGTLVTDPQQILEMGTDYPDESHGTHCAAIVAGSHITVDGNVFGGMAPDADIVLCPFQQNSLGDDENGDDNENDGDEEDDDDKAVMGIFNSIRFVHDYAQKEGKPYIISLSLNSQDGTHDGTSLVATTFEELIQNGSYMVLASSNEGGDSCYINRQFAENDTLHTFLPQAVEVYVYSRQTAEMGCQIGLFNTETKQEEWRSPLLTNKNGNMLLGLDFESDQVNDMGFDDHPEIVEEFKNTLAEVIGGVVNIGVGTQPNGHTCVQFETNGELKEPYVFTFHLTSVPGNIVDIWGDSGTTFVNLTGSDYYTVGSSSLSLGDWGTGGSIITVGSWAAKDSYTSIDGMEMDDGAVIAEGVYSPFSSYGTDLAGHTEPFISAPGNMIVAAVNSNDGDYVQTNDAGEPEYSPYVVGAVDGGYCWGTMSGTSMATPTVAGIVALWLEAKPDISYDEIKKVMAATATKDNFTDAYPIRYGNGKIDAYGGLLRILGITTRIPELSRQQLQDINIRFYGNRLAIDGAPEGTPIRVYTTDGMLVANSVIKDGSISLPYKAAPGVYAVQVGRYGSTLIRK